MRVRLASRSSAAMRDPLQQRLATAKPEVLPVEGCLWIEDACCKMMTNGLWRCSWPGGACTPGLDECPKWLTDAIKRLPASGSLGVTQHRPQAPVLRRRSNSQVARIPVGRSFWRYSTIRKSPPYRHWQFGYENEI